MVTSNKAPDKKVVKMEDQNNGANAPPRTLLGEINTHLTCVLCRGYFIDATTIVECLHSFCRSCIVKHLQVKSYCPVCEMMINSARPNIKPDKALQDIVYKLVPGLFQREMDRRRLFYSSRPGPAATATPEQRGEDTERIIFSPEDVISFSLEYADTTDTESVSSRSSESSNEQIPNLPTTRRFLQCPAVVNICHLKKFLSMKFDIDCNQFSIDILYKRVPLPDYYTLMDIAYIYNWKRNEPMRFFYQITDYSAIRSRYGLFDINRKGSHFRDQKHNRTLADEKNDGSTAPMNDGGSEASSDTGSPMPDNGTSGSNSNAGCNLKSNGESQKACVASAGSSKSDDEEVEKSQFLNSFELTAKNSIISPNQTPTKSSPSKAPASTSGTGVSPKKESLVTNTVRPTTVKVEDSPTKRKTLVTHDAPDLKKPKIEKKEIEGSPPKPVDATNANKTSLPVNTNSAKKVQSSESPNKSTPLVPQIKNEMPNRTPNNSCSSTSHMLSSSLGPLKVSSEIPLLKRSIPGTNSVTFLKRKLSDEPGTPVIPKPSIHQKTQEIRMENQLNKPAEPKPPLRKVPDLRFGVPNSSQINQTKYQQVNRIIRPDFLANNSDPTNRTLSTSNSSATPIPSPNLPPKVSSENPLLKRSIPNTNSGSFPKKKPSDDPSTSVLSKPSLPSKPQDPKMENQLTKPAEPKAPIRKIPDLRFGVPNSSQINQSKLQQVNRSVRPDFLANNSDPTKDRHNILSQVKSSLSSSTSGQSSGDALKSLFDSVKINIPSSLSITLTDQKQDQQKTGDSNNATEQKKTLLNKNNILPANSSNQTKNPSPPVHNYIEILKLPDIEAKNTNRPELSGQNQMKSNPSKSGDTPSAKGPIPSLKPIGDTNLGKQLGNFPKPTTFQQTFLQSLQQADKSKGSKNKSQVPKLMPAVPKNVSGEPKDSINSKPTLPLESKIPTTKSDSVLDLSTRHAINQIQLGPQQTKALETMQNIANLANKQNFQTKPNSVVQGTSFASMTNKKMFF